VRFPLDLPFLFAASWRAHSCKFALWLATCGQTWQIVTTWQLASNSTYLNLSVQTTSHAVPTFSATNSLRHFPWTYCQAETFLEARRQVIMGAITKNAVFCDVTPCSLVGIRAVESEGIFGAVRVGKKYRLRHRPQSKILTRHSNPRALTATVTIRLILKYRL
jgi:hypothetical protein